MFILQTGYTSGENKLMYPVDREALTVCNQCLINLCVQQSWLKVVPSKCQPDFHRPPSNTCA